MVKIVPHGIHPGNFVRPLIESIMTNGDMAPAKVRYEVKYVYPGGVIIKDPTGEFPGGLLKLGVPVHVEGEAEPSEEEIAPLVHAGHIPTSEIGGKHSDAADFAKPGGWDIRIFPNKKLNSPQQLATICDILIESGKVEFVEEEALRLINDGGARLNTRQEPRRVFKYYRPAMKKAGFLIDRRSS